MGKRKIAAVVSTVLILVGIASLVVQCLPEKLEKTCSLIESLPATEIPARAEGGKFVVLDDCLDIK